MNVMTRSNSIELWEDIVKDAERECSIKLEMQLEAYLVSLLFRYTDKPEIAKQLYAKAFLEAVQSQPQAKHYSLQQVGDQCLILTGLFPHAANRRCVNMRYFVDLGKTAYSSISNTANDLFATLAMEFILLMDVLQSIRPYPDLLPLEAYDQWHELGSQRAYRILQFYRNT